ncbi:phosphotransferase enzyme family protein [Octadecabacter ascidiaceicola]|uniref:Homoserine kinase n=1 Tax=Octadecabacter ascidiaceicola TaxID=1655543 RepID=A0A238KPV2_9RHOB|nr:phosphotransferase [Octadecabacter ascidiaceicola]SMX44661.1 homoserine kinase [Octadecabacter ascidiaceicola]
MTGVVEKALTLWGLTGARYTLVTARENAVYKISSPSGTFALRLHRQDYRTDTELGSELHWMKAVRDGGLSVPSPIPSVSGTDMHVIDDIQVDVLQWLDGETLETSLFKPKTETRRSLMQTLGQEMARLHGVCDAWQPPADFIRCAWDIDGLIGEEPLWDRFWDNPTLTSQERVLFNAFREKARTDLTDQGSSLDYGLVHADLVPANVMVDGSNMHFIDFDDGGFGYRIFDLATALLKHIDAPDYPDLKQALLDGYISERIIDYRSLDLFMALRATTYVGWNITRTHENNGTERNARFITTALTLVNAYLEQKK